MKRTKTHNGRKFKRKRLFDRNKRVVLKIISRLYTNARRIYYANDGERFVILRDGFCRPHSIFIALK